MNRVQAAGGSNPPVPNSEIKGLRYLRSLFFVPGFQKRTKSSPLGDKKTNFY